jgi:hypothetical protein
MIETNPTFITAEEHLEIIDALDKIYIMETPVAELILIHNKL